MLSATKIVGKRMSQQANFHSSEAEVLGGFGYESHLKVSDTARGGGNDQAEGKEG